MSGLSRFFELIDQVERTRIMMGKLKVTIMFLRAQGRLEQANKLSEFLHWAENDYDAAWLKGMFKGFP